MKKKQIIQNIGMLSIASIFVLSGCATQSSSKSSSAEEVVIAPSADNSTPTIPEMMSSVSMEPKIEVAKVPEPEPELGSVASVLQKMETSPYTLYWRGKNTYSYYVGGLFEAEYAPGVGLVVKDESAGDTSLTCKYDGAGSLGDAGKDAKVKEACAKLMFTLDTELSD